MVDENCKQLYSEPYMTPNNYDLIFNDALIPSNIRKESVINLTNRLQKLMPPSKIIHLNMETTTVTKNDHISIIPSVTINGKRVEFL
jgi:hypothetical protein